jgi:hypothetical protein
MHAPVTALLAAERAMRAVDMRSQVVVFPTQWAVAVPVAFTVEAVASTAAAVVASVVADTAVVVDTGKN